MINYVSVEEAIAEIKSGDRVFGHGSACTPNLFYEELSRQANRLKDVELVFITQQGKVPIAKPEFAGSFRVNSLFVSQPVREAVNTGNGDFVPIFLSEIPLLFRNGHLPLDVAMIMVSPPDRHGYCTLGC